MATARMKMAPRKRKSRFLIAAFEVMVPNKFLVKSAEQAFKVVPKVLNPTLHGKMAK